MPYFESASPLFKACEHRREIADEALLILSRVGYEGVPFFFPLTHRVMDSHVLFGTVRRDSITR
jgi:hypothetical protein